MRPKCGVAIAGVLGLVGCGPGYASSEEPQSTYTPSTYHAANSKASSDYERDVGGKGVYQGLYENEAAIRHYCGNGEGVTDPEVWLDACNRKLERVYWARVRTQYKYADWQEITDYCDLKPDDCASPKGLDSAIRGSHISGAQRENYRQSVQIEAEEAARVQAQEEAKKKFLKTLECMTADIASEAAGAECRGQRVVRCKTQMKVLGGADTVCIETPAHKDPTL